MKMYVKDGRETYRVASETEVLDSAKSVYRRRFKRGTTIRKPSDSLDLIRSEIGHLEHEVFAVAFLDNRHRLISFDHLFRGTNDGTSVHPRECLKDALKYNSAAVVLAHNHPSGQAAASQADERITSRLKKVFELVDIRILDHIIVAGEDSFSFAEHGLL